MMEENREGIQCQDVVREYMVARTESFKESTILSAWRKSGIRPLDPTIFSLLEFGPSFVSLTNPPLPESFPVQDLENEEALDLSSGNESHGSGDEGGREETKRDTEDHAAVADPEPTLWFNHAISPNPSDLPNLAQSTTPLPPLDPLLLNLNGTKTSHVHHEGGGEPHSGGQLGDKDIIVGTHLIAQDPPLTTLVIRPDQCHALHHTHLLHYQTQNTLGHLKSSL